MNVDSLIVYKSDGKIDDKKSNYDLLEKHAIDFLNLAQSFQNMAREKLQENFVSGAVESAETKRGTDGETPGANKRKKKIVGYHMLQYLMEPISVAESRFKYLTVRRNLSQMEVLGLIRSRIGFYAICNLFDRVEMKCAESEVTQQILSRHAERLQQLEKTMEKTFD